MAATAPAESYSWANVPLSVMLPHTLMVAAFVVIVGSCTTAPAISSSLSVVLVLVAVVMVAVTTRKFRLIFTWLMVAPQCVARVVPESWPAVNVRYGVAVLAVMLVPLGIGIQCLMCSISTNGLSPLAGSSK
jgi:hypothetical protein